MNDDNLYEIASRVGVERSYRNAHGAHTDSPPEAIAAVLQALGYDVSSDAARERAIAALRSAAKRPLPAASVVAPDAPEPIEIGADGDVDWRLVLEDGSVREGISYPETRRHDGGLKLEPLPAGYHRLTLGGSPPQEGWVLAAPPQAFLPDAILHGGRGFGVTAQVYGLRSPSNFGIGDFSDVGDLAEGAGRFGACFLGLSPLHALFPTDRTKISPYSPSSRLFIDPIYIDPTVLPDFPSSTAARFMNAPDCAAELDRLRATSLVEHAASWEAKRDILSRYWPRFGNAADPEFLAYRAELGEPLELHATFEALSEMFSAEGKHWVGDWPEPFRDAQGEAVRTFQKENPQKIAFHAWLQWLADRQLAAAQQRALDGGMTIGLYRDLAVGVDTGGAELWARPDWFLKGVAVGAPPDLLGPTGQNWGLPPFNPRTLEEQGLQAFRTLVAANMRHAGAIRIDHAFQLQRLYVVPDGMPATEGVYVDYPFAAMLAVLRIESHRSRALVIAEDLGTAPEGFADAIMGSDILSYRIVNFEREHDGSFKPPSSYPRKALAAIATHDLPTFAGWWKGLDTDLRQTFKFYTPEQAEHERGERVGDLAAFSRAAAQAGAQASDATSAEPPFEAAFRLRREDRVDAVGDPARGRAGRTQPGQPAGPRCRAPQLAAEAVAHRRWVAGARGAARACLGHHAGRRPRPRWPAPPHMAGAVGDLPPAVPQGLHLRACDRGAALSGAARHQPRLCLADPEGAAGLDTRLRHGRPKPRSIPSSAAATASIASLPQSKSTGCSSCSTSCRTIWASAVPTIHRGCRCSNGARCRRSPTLTTSIGNVWEPTESSSRRSSVVSTVKHWRRATSSWRSTRTKARSRSGITSTSFRFARSPIR